MNRKISQFLSMRRKTRNDFDSLMVSAGPLYGMQKGNTEHMVSSQYRATSGSLLRWLIDCQSEYTHIVTFCSWCWIDYVCTVVVRVRATTTATCFISGYHRICVSSQLSRSERRLRACDVMNVPGSNPAQTIQFLPGPLYFVY